MEIEDKSLLLLEWPLLLSYSHIEIKVSFSKTIIKKELLAQKIEKSLSSQGDFSIEEYKSDSGLISFKRDSCGFW